jgi:hypothetical protein
MSIEKAFQAVIEENKNKYSYFGEILISPQKTNDKYFFLIDVEDELVMDTGFYIRDAIKQRVNVMLIAKATHNEQDEVDEKLRESAKELMKIIKNNKRLVSLVYQDGFLQTCTIEKNIKGSNVFFGNQVRMRMLVYDCKYFNPIP